MKKLHIEEEAVNFDKVSGWLRMLRAKFYKEGPRVCSRFRFILLTFYFIFFVLAVHSIYISQIKDCFLEVGIVWPHKKKHCRMCSCRN